MPSTLRNVPAIHRHLTRPQRSRQMAIGVLAAAVVAGTPVLVRPPAAHAATRVAPVGPVGPAPRLHARPLEALAASVPGRRQAGLAWPGAAAA